MNYTALLLDVDGTLVPVGPYTMPSTAVSAAVKKARAAVYVCIVSGRPIEWLIELFRTLELSSPCIINGGSQIVDPQTHEIVWERPILGSDLETILHLARKQNIPILLNDNGKEYKDPEGTHFFKPLAVQLTHFDSKEQSDQFLRELQKLRNIEAHKFFAWEKDRPYQMNIYITHREATKQSAARELARILNIEPNTMIGVGDARNDIPLFEVCGLGIAMGNADDKLKMVAGYVCPPVDEDGVAHVIEKYVLKESESG